MSDNRYSVLCGMSLGGVTYTLGLLPLSLFAAMA